MTEMEKIDRIFGYVRVSTKEQNEDRQLIAMRELRIPERNLYIDKQSGKDFDRPQYQKLVRRLKKRRPALRQEHRPSGAQLWRDSGTVARPDERKGRGHRSAGYAPAGHATRQRPDGDVFERHCATGAVICRRKRAEEHPPASGGGNCGGESAGRPVRASSATAPGELPQRISTLESRKNYGDSGDPRMRDAVVHFATKISNILALFYALSTT